MHHDCRRFSGTPILCHYGLEPLKSLRVFCIRHFGRPELARTSHVHGRRTRHSHRTWKAFERICHVATRYNAYDYGPCSFCFADMNERWKFLPNSRV
jgi:hypothetical protein